MKKILILVAALMVMNMPSVHANIPVEQDVFVANDHDQFALPTSYNRVSEPIANQGNVSAIHQKMGWLGLKLVLILIILVNSFLFLKERRFENHEKNNSSL